MKWTDMRDVADPPVPDELIIGAETNRWPIQAFAHEIHALNWVKDAEPGYPRRLFRVSTDVLEELEIVPPSEPYLRSKGNPS